MKPLHIGTSGWSYDHWTGPFYPDGLAAGDRLAHYAGRFSTVEINNSFYHLPEAGVVDQWRDTVPADFVFSAKASRYITHMKKLKDPHEKPCRPSCSGSTGWATAWVPYCSSCRPAGT
ncbi:MAG: DUF72 domain-containing protein [Thiobacillus sp.]